MTIKSFNARHGITVGANTIAIVDANGNITANTILVGGSALNSTAFAGTANNASFLNGQPAAYYTNASNLSTGTINVLRLPTSGVTANVYGNSSSIPVVTVDTYGRVTSVTTSAVAGVTSFAYTAANSTFSIGTGAGSSYTATITAANSSVAGIVTVLDSVTNTSISIAASANTVKNAYDRAIDANTRAASAQTAAISAYSNAVSYTDSAIAAANVSGAAAIAYTNATSFASNVAATAYSNAVSVAASDATSKAATAYSNAVSTAAADATNKAANAYSNAISYAATIASTAYTNAVSVAATDATSKANNAYTTAVAAAASDATTKANSAYTIAVSVAASDATTKANNAYTTAVAAAASDASSKASTAYTNATGFAANASNISSGTLAEARLPYRMNQNVRTTDTVEFGNMTVTGNLTVTGTTVTVNANNLVVQDNMIYLNDGNTVANPDLGIAGNYNDGTYRHAGFFRDASDGVWKVYDQYLPEPDASPYIDTSNASFRVADFQANVVTMASANVGGATINSTSYSGAANNASYLGTYAASAYPRKSEAAAVDGAWNFSSGSIVWSSHSYTNTYDGSNVYQHIGQATSTNKVWNLRVYKADNSVSTFIFNSAGVATAENSYRAPLFYDINNTSYYVDPAGAANLNGPVSIGSSSTRKVYIASNGLTDFRFDDNGLPYIYLYNGGLTAANQGYGIVARFGSDGTNFYDGGRIQFSTDDSYASSGLRNSSIVMWTAASGTDNERLRISSAGVVTAYVDFRAPIFYDSNDTGYFINPNSTSVLSTAVILNANPSLILRDSDSDSGTNVGFISFQDNGAAERGWMGYGTSGNRNLTIRNSLGVVDLYGSYAQSQTSHRAPIFYDSDNTGYYVDPNSSSIMYGLRLVSSFDLVTNDVYGSLRVFRNAATSGVLADGMYIGYGNGNGGVTRIYGGGATGGEMIKYSTYTTESGSFRAPIFYDSDNTGYYIDAANSNVSLNINGRILGGFGAHTTSGTLDWNDSTNARSGSTPTLLLGNATNGPGGGLYYHPFSFEYGAKDGTGQLTQFAIRYADTADQMYMRGRYSNVWSGWTEFLTSSSITQTKAGILQSSASVRAPIFYDSNDTAYYTDPAATSVMSQINFGDSTKFIRGGSSGQTILGAGSVNDVYVQVSSSYYPVWNSGNFTPSNYLALTGGTLTGNLTLDAGWSGENGVIRIREGASNDYGAYIKYTASDTFEFGTRNGSTTDVAAMYLSRGTAAIYTPISYDSNNTAYYLDPASTTYINQLQILGGNPVYPAQWTTGYQSSSDFADGTLVTTDIPATASAGDSFIIEIVGKSYSATNLPFKVIAQGYLYNDTIINYTGASYAGTFSSYIKAFQDGGVLKFWWPRISYWNSFEVRVISMDGPTNNTITRNRVTSITNATEPTGTKKVQINLGTFMRADVTATNAEDLRAPIFYDSNNTGYYLNPNSTSNVVQINSNFITLNNDEGLNVKGIRGQFAAGSDGQGIHLFSNVDIGYPSGWGSGLGNTPTRGLSTYGGIRAAYSGTGFILCDTSIRTPIYYDSDNTAYYTNPNGTSVFNAASFASDITLPSNAGTNKFSTGTGDGASLSTYNFKLEGWYGMAFYNPTSGGAYPYTASGYVNFRDGWIDMAGSLRAPIFYDRDNTAYYADPHSTSQFNTIETRSGSGFRSFVAGSSSIASSIYFGNAANTIAWNWQIDENNRGALWSYDGSGWSKSLTISHRGAGVFLRNNAGTDVLAFSTSNFGYSTAYRTLVIGDQAYTTVCIGVDPVGNVSGSFNGGGSGVEVMFKNGVYFISPNSSNNSYNTNLYLGDGYAAATGSFRAPIFYDSNNTGYYFDGASTTNLVNLTVNGVLDIGASNPQYWRSPNSAYQRVDGRNDATLYSRMHWYGVRNDGATSNFRHAWFDGSAYFGVDADSGFINFTRSGGGAVTSDGSFRAPIFYDSNNTGYYWDGTGTSYWSTSQQNGWHYFNQNYGHGIVGLYASTRFQCVYAMGDAYKGNADGTSLSGAYGLWWSYPSAGGPAASLSSHGLMCIVNGTNVAQLDSSTRANGDMRAPIFYDLNDTSFYMDPHDTSVTRVQWIKQWGGTAASPTEYLDWPYPALTVSAFGNYTQQTMLAFALPNDGNYFTNDAVWNFRLNQTANATTSAGVSAMNFGGPGILYLNPSSYTQTTNSMRAPIFYDSNNTSYYIDPAGGSLINEIYNYGWYRSYGDTGWYNQSYGGGVYMTDTTYVKIYNSKALYVANNIDATGNITAYYSDERLKTRVGNIDDALDRVLRLDGFYYTENETARELGYNNDRQQVGVSAQKVQEVLPEAVHMAPVDIAVDEDGNKYSKTGENYLTVDYSRLVPLLIEAIKEQQLTITEQSAKINTLEAKLDQLIQKLEG